MTVSRDIDSSHEDTRAAFSDSAAAFLGRTDHRRRTRHLRHTEPAFERDEWQRIGELGWLSIVVPEAVGGLGLSLREAAMIANAAGEHLLPEPFVQAGVMPALTLAGLDASRENDRLLAGIADGSIVTCVAWQETMGELTPRGIRTTLETRAGTAILSGQKLFVEPGAGADGWIVLARSAGEDALLWIPADSSGVTRTVDRRVDGQLVCTLDFHEVAVADIQCLARGERVAVALSRACDGARLLQSAELVGLARRALAITLDYVKTRVQFGKQIGSFQALQHRLVDAAMQIELAAATVEELLHDSQGDALAIRASRAKARCARVAIDVTRLAIQMHGAMGNTDECEIGLYFKRALALNASLGSSAAHLQRYAQLRQPSDEADDLRQEISPAVAAAGTEDWEAMSETDFRRMLREFLAKNYPPALRHMPRPAHWEEVRDWYVAISARGWGAPAWPRQYGGMGLSAGKLMAFHDEMERYGVARWVDSAVEMLGPLLIKYGSEAQRHHYLPKILSGEHVWCQGYSEPNAGSDLGSLKTHAELEDNHFRINGRKIWTSHAQESTHIFMLVRTDKTAKSHAAISFVLVDMKTPGISVRTIEDLTGDDPFCEVTFDDVRVPVSALVGELNQGWIMAKALLGFERLFIANPAPAIYALSQLTLFAKAHGRFEDAAFVARYTELALDIADLSALYNRFADILKRGEQLTADISMLKILSTETWQRVALFLGEVAVEEGALLGDRQVGGQRVQLLSPTFNSLPSTIYGGSNEIQRNILARQVLGLPGN